jgi:hypothetical protein
MMNFSQNSKSSIFLNFISSLLQTNILSSGRGQLFVQNCLAALFVNKFSIIKDKYIYTTEHRCKITHKKRHETYT